MIQFVLLLKEFKNRKIKRYEKRQIKNEEPVKFVKQFYQLSKIGSDMKRKHAREIHID